jgi:hypothetical protein
MPEEDEAVSRRGVVKMTAFWLFSLLFSSFLSYPGERRRLFVLGLITYTPMPGVDSLRTRLDPFGVMCMRCDFLPMKYMSIVRSAWLVNSSA